MKTSTQSPSDRKQQAYLKGLQAGKDLLLGSTTVSDGLRALRDQTAGLARVLGWPVDEVTRQVVAYHRERLDCIPDLTLYTELRGYRELLVKFESGMRDAGVDDNSIALSQTLEFWRCTRLLQQTGKAYYAHALPAQCRILYLANSDRGALHLKNVDDPLTYWRPLPPIEPDTPWPFNHPLVFDGVSNGLHIDEIPPEIFPVDVHELCKEYCSMLSEAEDFMVRYNYFWRGQNLLIHDHQGNSVALEKTACRVARRGPNAQGINYITEMGALDPGISTFQKQQRQQWLDQIGEPWDDSPDGCAFTTYENQWRNMARYVDELSSEPTWANAKSLMEQRDPSGPMCLTGEKSHPREHAPGCTLWMDIYEMDNQRLHRRQWRDNRPAYLDTPEIVEFAPA
jgi:hypothetical protein